MPLHKAMTVQGGPVRCIAEPSIRARTTSETVVAVPGHGNTERFFFVFTVWLALLHSDRLHFHRICVSSKDGNVHIIFVVVLSKTFV